MTERSRRSIASKLTLMNMLVSGAALLLACTAFLAYDQVTFRDGLIQDALRASPDHRHEQCIRASVQRSPIRFRHPLALKNSPNISSAGILTADQRHFAIHERWQRRNFEHPPYSGRSASEA